MSETYEIKPPFGANESKLYQDEIQEIIQKCLDPTKKELSNEEEKDKIDTYYNVSFAIFYNLLKKKQIDLAEYGNLGDFKEKFKECFKSSDPADPYQTILGKLTDSFQIQLNNDSE